MGQQGSCYCHANIEHQNRRKKEADEGELFAQEKNKYGGVGGANNDSAAVSALGAPKERQSWKPIFHGVRFE